MVNNLTTVLSSAKATVEISRELPTAIIGERINPTGRKKVLTALQAGDFDVVRRDAIEQVGAGAAMLDINAGVPGADETELLVQALYAVMEVVDVPLCLDTANPKALAAALARYPGKALVNSVNGKESTLAATLPLVKEHGAAVIGLCMDEGGIPDSAEKRLAVADKILTRAAQAGIPAADVIIDPLVLTLGADHLAGRVALDTISLVVKEFGVNMTLGASNISFGLPDRALLNAAFIALAIQAGVTCPITNPLAMEIQTAVLAADLALGRDEYSARWIKAYRRRQKAAQAQAAAVPA